MKYLKKLIAGFLFLFAPTFIFADVTLGPYLQNATQTSMTIHWRSSSSGIGRVTYGTDINNLNQFSDEQTASTSHIVTVSGLQPNSQYYYRVGNGTVQEVPVDPSAQHFYTNPNAAVKTRIWVLGDAGTGNSDQNAVRDAYYNYTSGVRTNLVLALGDNAYSNGTDSEYVNRFFTVYQDTFVNTPIWSTQGNHERNQSVYEELFTHPTQGEAGGIASGSELYYSFNYGDIHFVCLDSYSSAIDIDPGAPQYQWLEQDLLANSKKWVVAFWHHPPYSKTSGHNSDTESGMRKLRENANVLLEQYGVDLVMGGHNHSYNRSYFINGHYGVESTFNAATHKVQDGDGATTPYQKNDSRGAIYVMSGSAGKVGYSIDSHDANVARYFNLGSFVIDIEGNKLVGRYLRETGAINDVFTIDKGPEVNTSPTVDAGVDGSVQLPNAFSLNGSVSDDNFPGNPLTLSWSQVSGPGVTTFAEPNAETTTATFSVAGSYQLRLTANDGEFTPFDDVLVDVLAAPVNQAPTANAGADLSVELPAPADLNGQCSDDGLPTSTLSAQWQGADVTFSNANAEVTQASFSAPGTYTVTLTCDDTLLSGADSAVITVTATQPNNAPVVDAGNPLATTVNMPTALAGSASDDGRPYGNALTITWSLLSGPASVTFSDANVLTSNATFSTDGEYVLQLTVSDGELSSNDSVAVSVSAEPVDISRSDFETDLGEWSNDSTGDSYDWTRDSGGTPSSSTGPNSGAGGSSYYLYLETSNGSGAYNAGDTAILTSPDILASQVSLRFDYHLYGSNMGTLSVDVFSGGSWNNDVWQISGQQQSSSSATYTAVEVDLSSYAVERLRLRATAAGGYRGDMAVDNLAIWGVEGPLPPTAPSFSRDPIVKAAATQDTLYSGETLAGEASDVNGDAITYSKVSGPAWLSVAANGDLGGTPAASDVGDNQFVVSASDGGLSSTANLTISVTDGALVVKQIGFTDATDFDRNSTHSTRRAMTFTMSESGEIISLAAHHAGGSGDMLLGLYADDNGSPGALLAATPVTTVSSSSGYQTINLQNSINIVAGTKIWIAWVFDSNPGIAYRSTNSGETGRYNASGSSFSNGMPADYGSASEGAFAYAVYANYQAQ